jgi:hypothetical protein
MQIEVPPERIIDKMAREVAQLTYRVAQLTATNEMLVERLRDYVQRDQQAQSAPKQNGSAPVRTSD